MDDFAVACADFTITQKVIADINCHVTTDEQGMEEKEDKGHTTRYNGLDISQSSKYIMVSCENYVERMLRTHRWSAPRNHKTDIATKAPLSMTASQELQLKKGPTEGMKEHKTIQDNSRHKPSCYY